jgi:hypothetical protein
VSLILVIISILASAKIVPPAAALARAAPAALPASPTGAAATASAASAVPRAATVKAMSGCPSSSIRHYKPAARHNRTRIFSASVPSLARTAVGGWGMEGMAHKEACLERPKVRFGRAQGNRRGQPAQRPDEASPEPPTSQVQACCFGIAPVLPACCVPLQTPCTTLVHPLSNPYTWLLAPLHPRENRSGLSRVNSVGASTNEPQRREEHREKRQGGDAHTRLLSVTYDQLAEYGPPRRSSRLCGSFGSSSIACFRLGVPLPTPCLGAATPGRALFKRMGRII